MSNELRGIAKLVSVTSTVIEYTRANLQGGLLGGLLGRAVEQIFKAGSCGEWNMSYQQEYYVVSLDATRIHQL